ncbi:hypothetical protein MRX96_033214 [Rhipicephalus microplus]
MGNDVVIGGSVAQRITSCMEVMDCFLSQKHPVVSSFFVKDDPSSRSDPKNKQDLLLSAAHILGIKDPSSLKPEHQPRRVGHRLAHERRAEAAPGARLRPHLVTWAHCRSLRRVCACAPLVFSGRPTSPLTASRKWLPSTCRGFARCNRKGRTTWQDTPSGGMVAFEVAVQMQASGESVGSLAFLDGAPGFLDRYTAQRRGRSEIGREEHETDLLVRFLCLYLDLDVFQIKRQLSEHSTFEDKREAAIDILISACSQDEAPPSRDVVGAAMRRFYEFGRAGSLYRPQSKYSGDVLLLKPSRIPKTAQELTYDYGLSECCEGNVEVIVVDGAHEDFILGEGAQKCADIIYRQLQR